MGETQGAIPENCREEILVDLMARSRRQAIDIGYDWDTLMVVNTVNSGGEAAKLVADRNLQPNDEWYALMRGILVSHGVIAGH
jgi:hypothetical protein